MSPTSILSPPYGSIVWASEALAVLVAVEPVLVLVPVEVAGFEVAAAVAGREESFASVYHHDLLVSVFCLNRTWSLDQPPESVLSQYVSRLKLGFEERDKH